MSQCSPVPSSMPPVPLPAPSQAPPLFQRLFIACLFGSLCVAGIYILFRLRNLEARVNAIYVNLNTCIAEGIKAALNDAIEETLAPLFSGVSSPPPSDARATQHPGVCRVAVPPEELGAVLGRPFGVTEPRRPSPGTIVEVDSDPLPPKVPAAKEKPEQSKPPAKLEESQAPEKPEKPEELKPPAKLQESKGPEEPEESEESEELEEPKEPEEAEKSKEIEGHETDAERGSALMDHSGEPAQATKPKPSASKTGRQSTRGKNTKASAKASTKETTSIVEE